MANQSLSSVSAPPRSAPDATPRRTEADRPTTLRLTSRSPPRRLVLALGREDSWHRSDVPGRRSPRTSSTRIRPSVRTRVSPVHASDALHQGSTAAPIRTSVAATRSAAAPAVQGGCGTRQRRVEGRERARWASLARRRAGTSAADTARPRHPAAPRGGHIGRSRSDRRCPRADLLAGRLRNTMLKTSRSIVNAPTAAQARQFRARARERTALAHEIPIGALWRVVG